MNFKVVFATTQGVATKKYKGTDSYDIVRGGVLRIEVQQAPERGVHYFPPGSWIELAEYADPITPKLESG